jgi:diphosphate-dependent phosphofructokinase
MEKSALQIARAAYQPKLPKALQGPVKAVEGAATQSVGNQEEIKALFPNTYGMPVITFEAGEAQELPAFNVGVILSGLLAPLRRSMFIIIVIGTPPAIHSAAGAVVFLMIDM